MQVLRLRDSACGERLTLDLRAHDAGHQGDARRRCLRRAGDQRPGDRGDYNCAAVPQGLSVGDFEDLVSSARVDGSLLNTTMTSATTREDAIAVLDYTRKLLLAGVVER